LLCVDFAQIISPETLEGIHTNLHTVMAISACDLMVIEEDVFNSVQAKGVTKISVEQKFRILSQVPVFRAWEPYKLYRIAYNLEHAEIPKETVIFRRGETTDRLYILIHGQIDLVHDARRRDQILTTVQPGNYFGESSVCTFYTNGKVKVEEDATAITSSHVEVLVYGEAHFQMLDSQSLTSFTRAFESKRKWRARRARTLKQEHRALREAQQKMRDDVHGEAPIRASLRDTSSTATSSVSTLSEQETTTATARPQETFDLDDLPQEIMRGYDPLFVLNTCKNPRKRQQVLNALKRAQPETSLAPDDNATLSSLRISSPPRTSPDPASAESGNAQINPLRPMAALLSPKIQPITGDEFPELTLKSLPQRIRSVTYMTPALHALQHRIKLAEDST
jgi:CRP-like cAMP-binding protein